MVKQETKKKLFTFNFQPSKYKGDDSSEVGSETVQIRKNITYGTKLQAAKGTFVEYLKESSIHGFKYIGNYKHSIAEREFYWDAISQVCNQGVDSETTLYGKHFANVSDLTKAMELVAPAMYEVVPACLFRSLTCEKRLKRVITEEGICYSFNSLTSNHYQDELINAQIQDRDFYNSETATTVLNWNIEKGYNKGEDLDSIPSRVIATDTKEGLFLLLVSQKKDQDVICSGIANSFKVILHTPGEEPIVSRNFIEAAIEKTSLITIKPKIVEASDGLKAYEAQRRQCFYHENDRVLRYFKVYNQPNCELECLANKTLDKCGCVKFSMPRNSSHPVCGSLQSKCISEVKDESKNMDFNQANDLNLNQHDNSSALCNCLPLCSSIQYKAELKNQIDLDFASFSRAYKFEGALDEFQGLQFTAININFKEEVFTGLKRSELYSDSDMIADFGGLLGLFMGVSILSLVELVYFCTIKLWTNLKMRQIKNKQRRKFKEAP